MISTSVVFGTELRSEGETLSATNADRAYLTSLSYLDCDVNSGIVPNQKRDIQYWNAFTAGLTLLLYKLKLT